MPAAKLEDDVMFHAGDLFVCEQRTSLHEPATPKGEDVHHEEQAMGVFRETLKLKRIKLGKVMEMQRLEEKTDFAPRTTFAALETIKL